MLDLEEQIARWRKQMAGGGIKAPAVLDELESHLRDEVDRQTKSGMNEEQAFKLAIDRIGNAGKLKAEFGKVEDTRKMRGKESLRRWSVVMGAGFVYLVLSSTWYLGVHSGKLEITSIEIAFAAGAIVPMILLGWAGRSLAQSLPVVHENWSIVIAFGALFSGAALFRTFLPVIAPTNLVHLQIFLLWILSPALGFGNCVSAWHDRCHDLRGKPA